MSEAKRNLTDNDHQRAKRLRALWHDHKNELHLTQTKAAIRLGYTQSAVSQFLSGTVALNYENVLAFANLLNVNPSDIAPELARMSNPPSESYRGALPVLNAEGETVYASYNHQNSAAFIVTDDEATQRFLPGDTLVVHQPHNTPSANTTVLCHCTDGIFAIRPVHALNFDNVESIYVIDQIIPTNSIDSPD